MSSGVWIAVTVPKKEFELRHAKEQKEGSKSSSKESLDKKNGDVKSKEPDNKGDSLPDSLPASEKQRNSEGNSLVYFVEKQGPMEETLQEALTLLGIIDAVWMSERNDKYHQVYFPCETTERCDIIMRSLSTKGFGIYGGTTLAVLPCAVFFKDQPVSVEDEEPYSESEAETDDTVCNESQAKGKSDFKKSIKGFKSMQQQFLKSVTARLTVAQVVESVRAGSQLTFDYVMFVVLASMIAAFGLMENSSVVIVASMLISPLMGPILAGTFGAVIRDKALLNLGLKAELIGLFLCTFIGFIIGLVCGSFGDSWGPLVFPTPEMSGRGQDRSLWVGILIALPSGAGVALSVLGGNAGSLVGVAISASLLPPAVNAGLLWGLAAIKRIQSLSAGMEWIRINEEPTLVNVALVPPKDYAVAYHQAMDAECAILGVVSLLLTIVNIICIVLSAMLVLKIKEVAPMASLPKTNRFWKQDIKIARDYNKTLTTNEGKELGKRLLSEWADLNGVNREQVLSRSKEAQLTGYQTLQDMMQDVEEDDVYQTVMQYVPGSHPRTLQRRVTMATIRDSTKDLRHNHSLGDPELGGQKSPVKRAFYRMRQGKFPKSDAATNDKSAGVYDHSQEFDGVELRKPAGSSGTQSGPNARYSNVLRHSLQSSFSPAHSLWPASSRVRRLTNAGNPRFVVTPVVDPIIPPLPPRYSRNKLYAQVESNT